MRSPLDDFNYLPGEPAEYAAAVEAMLDDLIAGRPILPTSASDDEGPLLASSDEGPLGPGLPPYDDGYWRQ